VGDGKIVIAYLNSTWKVTLQTQWTFHAPKSCCLV